MRHNVTIVRYTVAGAAALAFLLTQAAHASTWSVDKAHSRVGFSVTHLGINTVEGIFKVYDAKVVADEASGKIKTVTAEVTVDSVDTGVEKRDAHLRAEDLFNAAEYPKMKLVTKKIKWNGNQLSGTAELTIRGITQPVKFKGKVTKVKTLTMNGETTKRVGYAVTATIDRKKFGLNFGTFSEGLSMVGEEVKIALSIALVRPL